MAFLFAKQRNKLTIPIIAKMSKRKERSDISSDNSSPKLKSKKTTNNKITINASNQPIPRKNKYGELQFEDHPEFSPNLTPEEVLRSGSFGGTYFRTIQSGVTHQTYKDAWKEFPKEWFEGLDVSREIASSKYNVNQNKYKVECGKDLGFWESSGWILPVDPFGWFQWYCRFYLGRRCDDDARQISRGNGVMGPRGRWRTFLCKKCIASGRPLEQAVDDPSISPKVRQLLQHWGYRLTLRDLEEKARAK
jgi:hypothetical protein